MNGLGKAWFEQTVIGKYVANKEQQFLSQYEYYAKQGVAVWLGGISRLMPSEKMICVPDDVQTDLNNPAFAPLSADSIWLAHAHEYTENPLQVLKEAYRILKSGGRLILTGFNPQSLWGLTGRFDGNALPLREHCFALPDFKKQISELGFGVEFGKLMVYVPYIDDERRLASWRFMEKAGDRWWPQMAAVYGMVLVKEVAAVTPLENPCEAVDLFEESVPVLAKNQADTQINHNI